MKAKTVFGPGPRRPLDREQRARFKFLLNAHCRVGRITDKGGKVGVALLKRLSDDGRCDPSHAGRRRERQRWQQPVTPWYRG